MPFFVGYFLSLMRPNSNLMWHDVFVTAPLFRHIVFNAWFRSFVGTLVYFGWFFDVLWTRIFYLRPPSFWYDTASFIEFDSHQHHQYKVIHRKYCLKLEYQLTLHKSHYLALYDAGIVLNRCGRTYQLTLHNSHYLALYDAVDVVDVNTGTSSNRT